MSADALQPLFFALDQTRLANYFAASALTVAVYDAYVSIYSEVDHVWRARWSPAKGLYLFTRYYGIAYLIFYFTGSIMTSPSRSSFLWISAMGGPNIFTMLVNIIFVMRLYALYNRSTKILVFLLLFLFAEFVAETYATISTETRLDVLESPLGLPWPGCIPFPKLDPTTNNIVSWTLCLSVSFLFFVMTLVKFIRTASNGESIKSLFRIKNLSPLAGRFITDGTLFFFIIFSVVIFGLIMSDGVKTPLATIASPWVVSLYSISGSRLILNLRVTAATGQTTMDSVGLLTSSANSSAADAYGRNHVIQFRNRSAKGSRRLFGEFDYSVGTTETIELGNPKR